MWYNCFTDWSSINNPWPWWWAWVIVENGSILKRWSWWVPVATNNQMELQATIELLKSFISSYENRALSWEWLFDTEEATHEYFVDIPLTITTDSTYVQKWITERLPVWVGRWWRRSKWWKIIANVNQRKELYKLVWYFDTIDWLWTKAHVGTKRNERVDIEARNQAMKEWIK